GEVTEQVVLEIEEVVEVTGRYAHHPQKDCGGKNGAELVVDVGVPAIDECVDEFIGEGSNIGFKRCDLLRGKDRIEQFAVFRVFGPVDVEGNQRTLCATGVSDRARTTDVTVARYGVDAGRGADHEQVSGQCQNGAG